MAQEFDKEIIKKEADKIAKNLTRTKGSCVKAIIEYLNRIGEADKIYQIENIFSDCGYQVKLEKIEANVWYPISIEVILILSLVKILKWEKEEIKNLGRNVPKLSFVIRILTKFFISAERFYKEAPGVWRRHFDSGELETPEFNKKEKYHILRIKNFDILPIYCIFLSGFFESITYFLVKSDKIWSEETECVFRGGRYHEFKISWK